MKPIEKQILLYHLLHSRKYVTIDTIKKVCNISQRTAYRYLKILSEINIPIIFDKSSRGYYLNQKTQRNDCFNIDSGVLILVGLKYLRGLVNTLYRERIDSVIKEFTSKQEYPLEELIDVYNERYDDTKGSTNIPDMISSLFIFCAIQFEKKIKILTENCPHISKQIEKPRIYFNDGWRIGDYANLNNSSSLDNIMMVKIENK